MTVLIYPGDLGSAEAEKAISFGGLVASALRESVSVLHLARAKEEEEILALEQVISKLRSLGISTDIKVRRGDPLKQLRDELYQGGYRLLVLPEPAPPGRPLSRIVRGILKVRERHIPILIVKGMHEKLERIMLCIGGGHFGWRLIEFGTALAQGAGAQVTILHVVGELPVYLLPYPDEEERLEDFLRADDPAAQQMKRAAQALSKRGILHKLRVREGVAEQEILGEAAAGDYDLIMLGGPTPRLFERALLGDVAHIVLRCARRPVLIVD